MGSTRRRCRFALKPSAPIPCARLGRAGACAPRTAPSRLIATAHTLRPAACGSAGPRPLRIGSPAPPDQNAAYAASVIGGARRARARAAPAQQRCESPAAQLAVCAFPGRSRRSRRHELRPRHHRFPRPTATFPVEYAQEA